MADNKMSKVSAGLLGAAVGVAAGAATVMLSDKKKREMAIKKAKMLHRKAEETVEDIQKKAQKLVDKVEEVKDEILNTEDRTGAKEEKDEK